VCDNVCVELGNCQLGSLSCCSYLLCFIKRWQIASNRGCDTFTLVIMLVLQLSCLLM